MGVETALIGLGVGAKTAGIISTATSALSALSAVSSIVSGSQSRSEGNNQAALALAQADARGVEAARVAEREARLVQEDALKTERKQKLAYLASGVTLEGSPLLVMEETRQKGLDNVNEILMSGNAAANAARLEGRVIASQAKSAGRQSFVSGLTNGIQTFSRLGEK